MTSSPEDLSSATTSLRVLLVDDNEDVSELFAVYLQSVGYDVRTANDGPSALDLAATFLPAVAVLDIGLPVMDGYQLATKLRERLSGSQVRLIAMSGYGQREDRERSLQAGFEQHLVKPVDPQALIDAIKKGGPVTV